jgi:putative DNA methylase
MERRFIEDFFPLLEVTKNSKEETNQKINNIKTLHNWWGRKTLSASRASIYASLIKLDEKKIEKIQTKISLLSKIANQHNYKLLNEIQNEIKKTTDGNPPKILDPFGGGGSIPLEGLRLGCDVYSNDYNPISIIIQKCMIEYPQMFNNYELNNSTSSIDSENILQKEVKKWSEWVLNEVKQDLNEFYSTHEDKKQVSSIWCWVIKCQNPTCGADLPLINDFWLCKKIKKSPIKKIAFFPESKNKIISFKLVGDGYEKIPEDFDPSKGTQKECLACGRRHKLQEIRKIFLESKAKQRLLVVIFKSKTSGKYYKIADDNDYDLFLKSEKYLKQKEESILKNLKISPLPLENTPQSKGRGAERAFGINNYGISSWDKLYNSRQKLVMITFFEKIRYAHQSMIESGLNEEFAKVVTTYLGLIHSKLADWNCILTNWLPYLEKQGHVFSQATMSFTLDYCENNPLEKTSGSWEITTRTVMGSLKVFPYNPGKLISITNNSADSLNYEDNFFDLVITDPPFYDSIPYSYLSDFFYVWQKRSLGFLYPELFVTPLTPKTQENVLYTLEHTWDDAKKIFEEKMLNAFTEIYRILKDDGVSIVIYTHKTTDGWETLINSLLRSGLTITAAWPIHSSMDSRRRSQDSATLASSIYMVCRKLKKEPIGFYRDVKKELKTYLEKRLEQIWKIGISGADLFISAIGSAVEVYGKYEKVLDDSDNVVSTLKLLNDTRNMVANYAINKVIKGEFSDKISQMTRFYILWRWAYGEAKVPSGEADKMALSVGIDINHELNKGLIVKDKEDIRILGPSERTKKEFESSEDLIDILHQTLLIWKKDNKEAVDKFLEEKGYKNNEILKRVAQAITESLPIESTEKKWLDGFLTDFKSNDSQSGTQSKLVFEDEK